MIDKNLRKLNRRQLLEILLEQTKRIEVLVLELQNTKEKFKVKKVIINNVGSLAEASLALSNIFKAADEAIAIQMQNVENIAKEEEKRIRKELREFRKKEKEKFLKKNIAKVEEKKSSKNVKDEKKNSKKTKTVNKEKEVITNSNNKTKRKSK